MKKNYGYVEVHAAGFPLKTSEPFNDRSKAVDEANRAYRRAVNTGEAYGIRFGVMDEQNHVSGRLITTKQFRKHPGGPFR